MLLLHIVWYLQKSLFSEFSQLIAERPDASLEAEVSQRVNSGGVCEQPAPPSCIQQPELLGAANKRQSSSFMTPLCLPP